MSDSDGIDIGGQSRRFQATVIVVTMLTLLAGSLAAASLDGSGSIIDLGTGEGEGEAGDGEPVDGDGNGVGGWDLPDVLVDLFGLFVDGDEQEFTGGELPPPPYDISVEPEPTPGAFVVVTVAKDDDPVPAATVALDGEPVGRTNASGQVAAQMPYTEAVTVTALPPGGGGENGSSFVLPSLDPSTGGTPGTSPTSRLGAGPSRVGVAGSVEHNASADSSVTYELRTDVSARVDGVALPGETATVAFTIADNPLPGVDVTRDGEGVGITDSDGRVAIEIPPGAELAGSLPVSLARGEFADTADVEVGDVRTEFETGLLALPYTGATVEVSAVDSTDEEPLGGVPVTVTEGEEPVVGLATDDGVTEGVTDEDGRLSVRLPLADSVTAAADTDHETRSTTVSGLYLRLAGAVMALVVAVAGLAVWGRGTTAGRRRARERLVGLALVAGSLVERAGRRLAHAAAWLWARAVTAARRLRAGLGGRLRGRSLPTLVLAGPRWLLERLRVTALWLFTLPGRLAGDDQGDGAAGAGTTRTAAGRAADTGPVSADERLRRLWRSLVRQVVRRTRARTMTPVEVEQRAIERGLPAAAVRRLRRAFQAVEYGPADATDRVEEAETAHEQLDGGEDATDT